MNPPRRAQLTLGALGMVLLFGILGLAWWWWRHRPGYQPAARFPRLRAALAAAGLAVIAAGTAGRLAAALQPVSACSSARLGHAAARSDSFGVSVLAQIAATWPETGIGLLYARAGAARVCWSGSQEYYVAVRDDNIAGARAMTVGDIVLTPENLPFSGKQLRAVAAHESRHRVQWAVATVIGGPLAFPVAYAIDDFFFPGARNQFERLAGLEAGGYSHEGTGPVLGPAQLTALGVLAAVIVVVLLRVRHRRVPARLRSRR